MSVRMAKFLVMKYNNSRKKLIAGQPPSQSSISRTHRKKIVSNTVNKIMTTKNLDPPTKI